jgi:delta11-fatty-acid desaturase
LGKITDDVFLLQGYWFSIIALPIAAWLAAAAIVHDAMHFAISTNWKINFLFSYVTPWTASPLMWYHQHVIGHHAYPNIPFKDPDLAHAPGFMRLHTSVRWKPIHKFQMITLGIIWTLGAALYMTVVPIKALCLGALNRSVKLLNISVTRKIAHVLGRLFVVFLLWGWQWYVFQGDLAKQILFTAVPMMIHSLCFMISTQFNHLTPENVAASSNEYYTHQVVTSHSFSMKSQFVFWLTGGLNVQIEHHLFPAVNHCHLRQISPIVVRLCKKYSIPYHESTSIFEALSKHFAHVSNMSHK